MYQLKVFRSISKFSLAQRKMIIHKGSRKKKKVPPLVAGPLRGGEGGKGRATKEKRTFFKTFFLFCCHLKIKIILL